MAETVNIAGLAALVSDKIFRNFNWGLADIQDENFPCEKIEKHQTKGAGGKHPVDCVFYYSDPFSNKTVYLLCDLKSYAAATIPSKDFGVYIRGISKAIDCAWTSATWQRRYVPPSVSDWVVDGLLFVYNNDSLYDASFKKKAKGLAPSALPHSKSARVHLLDPDDISYLQAVVKDMKSVCGERDLDYAQRRFFYPHHLVNKPGDSRMPVATIEMLRGRMLIAVLGERGSRRDHYFVYLKGDGRVEDFEYVVTYLYRNGIMELAEAVTILGTSFSPDAQSHLNVAKGNFLLRHYNMKEIKASLERVVFSRVDTVADSFSTVDVALLRRK